MISIIRLFWLCCALNWIPLMFLFVSCAKAWFGGLGWMLFVVFGTRVPCWLWNQRYSCRVHPTDATCFSINVYTSNCITTHWHWMLPSFRAWVDLHDAGDCWLQSVYTSAQYGAVCIWNWRPFLTSSCYYSYSSEVYHCLYFDVCFDVTLALEAFLVFNLS